MKDDGAKLRYDLIDEDAEAEMVGVLTHGAVKYEAENWRHVSDPFNRYFAALRRHLHAYRSGETIDPDSGFHHLAAAACCVHFMLALDLADRPTMRAMFKQRLRDSVAMAREIKARRKK